MADRGLGTEDIHTFDHDLVERNDSAVNSVEWLETPELPPRTECTLLPVPLVLAHGFLGTGDTWNAHHRRLIANGFCAERFHTFDWNSLNRTADHVADLEQFIENVRMRYQVNQVDLVGHSAGGNLGYEYLTNSNRASTVRRYVHVGSFPSATLPGPDGMQPIPTLNLYSANDTIVEGADIEGAVNVRLETEDHYEVATSDNSFRALYRFLLDEDPEFVEEPAHAPAIVSGRYLTFAENEVVLRGIVESWRIDAQNGDRLQPLQRFETDEDGYWGPLLAEPNVSIEIVGTDPDPRAPVVRHFYEPFKGDTMLTYLRGFPGPGSLAGAIVNLLPKSNTHTTLVIYNARGAFLHGRDSLRLNGQELLNEETASASNTTIAFFIYDIGNDDQVGGSSPIFDMFPFLAAVDRPLSASTSRLIELDFNGRRIVLPQSPSNDGILVAVFQ